MADSTFPFDVSRGFDVEGASRFEDVRRCRIEPRRKLGADDREADAMAQPMREVGAVAGLLDDLTGGAIRLRRSNPWTQRGQGRFPRGKQGFEHLANMRVGRAQDV